MKLFKRILVPIDFGPASEDALAYARMLAEVSGERLYLVHVIDDTTTRYLEFQGMETGRVQAELVQMAEERLNDLARWEDVRRLGVSTKVLVGANVANALVEFAEDKRVDLVVMGTHGRAPAMRMLLGSVADRVVRTAPCPVMVVREQQMATMPIGVQGGAACELPV